MQVSPSMIKYVNMKFGSWTYDGSKINLTARSDSIDI